MSGEIDIARSTYGNWLRYSRRYRFRRVGWRARAQPATRSPPPPQRRGRCASSSELGLLCGTSSIAYYSFCRQVCREKTRKKWPIDPLSWEQEGWLTRWKTVVAPVAFAAARFESPPLLHARTRACVQIRACPAKVSARARTFILLLHARFSFSRRNERQRSLRARIVPVAGQS